MSKLYNTQKEITTNISNMIKKFFPNIRKTHLNIIPSIIFGMIDSESVVTSDIAKSLKDSFSLNLFDSNKKRIYRFFNNNLFYGYLFYDYAIKFIISNFLPKHKDNRIHISFDHMYIHDRFSIFMLTMRIGNQGIPLWYRCFYGPSNESDPNKNCSNVFQTNLFIESINYVSDLFKNKNVNLIFLADRWFGTNSHILHHINSLHHTYVIRTKGNIKAFYQTKKQDEKSWTTIHQLQKYVFHSTFYPQIEIFSSKYKTNLIINKSFNHKESWYLLTNGDPKRAVKDYSYRFGSIECLFKNQKSNGFYLESTATKNLNAFINLYSLVCFSVLWLTIYGTYFEKNKYRVFKNIKIKTSYKNSNGSRNRYFSLFNIGLTLFKLARDSLVNILIPYSLKMYDI